MRSRRNLMKIKSGIVFSDWQSLVWVREILGVCE